MLSKIRVSLKKYLKNNKKRLTVLISGNLVAVVTISLLIFGGASALVVYQVTTLQRDESFVQEQNPSTETLSIPEAEVLPEEEAQENDNDTVDLAPDQYVDDTVTRDTRYMNIHDMQQEVIPTVADGWTYIAPNGDMYPATSDCNFAYLLDIPEGTIGVDPGVPYFYVCSRDSTVAEILDKSPGAIGIMKNPKYIPPSG